MKENKYDNEKFFEEYSKMNRSINGLDGAGEWHELKKLLPDFEGKRVLDLGCGFGWHCIYAIENKAELAVGIDISQKMLKVANEKKTSDKINYICMPIEDIDYKKDSFDIVISSLAFHYIESFEDICKKLSLCITKGGSFVFSVEHPIFTAYGSQDWYYNEKGDKIHWPVDNYFYEGKREAHFLNQDVIKFHKTLTTYLNSLLNCGFEITNIVEPMPEENMLKTIPEMKEELRRPMMLLVSAIKK